MPFDWNNIGTDPASQMQAWSAFTNPGDEQAGAGFGPGTPQYDAYRAMVDKGEALARQSDPGKGGLLGSSTDAFKFAALSAALAGLGSGAFAGAGAGGQAATPFASQFGAAAPSYTAAGTTAGINSAIAGAAPLAGGQAAIPWAAGFGSAAGSAAVPLASGFGSPAASFTSAGTPGAIQSAIGAAPTVGGAAGIPLASGFTGPGLASSGGGFLDFLKNAGKDVLKNLGGANNPMLSPQQNAAAQNQQRMAMAATLLNNAGPVPRGTQNPLGAFGKAILAGQESSQQSTENALKAQMIQAQMQHLKSGASLIGSASPADFSPASLAKYKETQNPADLVPIEKNMFGRFQPRDYTPESLKVFDQTKDPGDLRRVANYQPQNLPGGGIGGFNPVSGQIDTSPVNNDEAQRQAAALARAKAEGTASGEATGKAQGAMLSKAVNAGNINSILDIAEPLIDEATGSGSGAIRDKLAAWFGESTTGAQATAQLLPLQAALMLNQPRMEGPQSDKDVELYRQAAGQIGDPTVPRETKKAAIRTIRRLQEQYTENAGGKSSKLPDGVTEDDIKETMRANKMTRQQVLERLNAR